MKLRSGTQYDFTPEKEKLDKKKNTILLTILELIKKCENVSDTLEEMYFTQDFFDYIESNIDFIESSSFLEPHSRPEFYRIIKHTSEQMMDKIDSLLLSESLTANDKTVLLDTMESISSVYYTWFPIEDYEHDYLNSYLED
jgi:hypothetical protein